MKKNIAKILIPTVLIFMLAVTLSPVAQAVNLDDAKEMAENLGLATKYDTFGEILLAVLKGILSLAFLGAMIFIVLSGYQMITSRGNDEEVTKAKKALLWSVIGLLLIIFSWIILGIVIETTKTLDPGELPSSQEEEYEMT